MAETYSVETIQDSQNEQTNSEEHSEIISKFSTSLKLDAPDTFESIEKNASKFEDSQNIQSKDLSRRKRTSRTAKIKQCKLDARREQWLSQATVSLNGFRAFSSSTSSSSSSSSFSVQVPKPSFLLDKESENSYILLNDIQQSTKISSQLDHSSSLVSKINAKQGKSRKNRKKDLIHCENSTTEANNITSSVRENDFENSFQERKDANGDCEGKDKIDRGEKDYMSCACETSLPSVKEKVKEKERHGLSYEQGAKNESSPSCTMESNSIKGEVAKKKSKQTYKKDVDMEGQGVRKKQEGIKEDNAQEEKASSNNSSSFLVEENSEKVDLMETSYFNGGASPSSNENIKKKKWSSELKNAKNGKMVEVDFVTERMLLSSVSSSSSSLFSDKKASTSSRCMEFRTTMAEKREIEKEEKDLANESRGEDDFDDWEMAADTIYLRDEEVHEGENDLSKTEKEKSKKNAPVMLNHSNSEASSTSNFDNGDILRSSNSRHDYEYSNRPDIMKSHSVNGRAWRHDDSSRPHSLPPLLHSNSLNALSSASGLSFNRQDWNSMVNASASASPGLCPICAEELDVTDTSFVPCSCGFRLCLFCHHRIASEDGRCPGCRKTYSTESTPAGSSLPRSQGLWLRV